MRSTLIALGISETTFIKECDATFKQGAKFAKWTTGEESDFYYHPLMLPQGFSQTNLGPYWQTVAPELNESFPMQCVYKKLYVKQAAHLKAYATQSLQAPQTMLIT